LRFRCLYTRLLKFSCLHTRVLSLRCLYTWVLRFRCLYTRVLRFRCLHTRVLRLRCLYTRVLRFRCLHTRVLRLRCLYTRVLRLRCFHTRSTKLKITKSTVNLPAVTHPLIHSMIEPFKLMESLLTSTPSLRDFNYLHQNEIKSLPLNAVWVSLSIQYNFWHAHAIKPVSRQSHQNSILIVFKNDIFYSTLQCNLFNFFKLIACGAIFYIIIVDVVWWIF